MFAQIELNNASMPEVKIQFLSSLVGYVEDIYQTYLQSTKEDLSAAAMKLKEMAPAPMNSMLDKQPREEAIAKRAKRMKMFHPPVHQVHNF